MPLYLVAALAGVLTALIVLGSHALVRYIVRRERRRQTATVNRAAEILEEENDVVQRWKSLYEEECRKREEQFMMIEGIQKERDGWKNIFWQCSSEHGVAQEYMVRINQHFAKICGKHPDAKMSAIRKAFEEKYGDPAKSKIAVRIERGLPGVPAPGEAPIPREDIVITAVSSAPPAENADTEPVVVAKPDPNA